MSLTYIDPETPLIDVDRDAWSNVLAYRGGCRCHISAPCSACTEPLTEGELTREGYTSDKAKADGGERCERCGGAGEVVSTDENGDQTSDTCPNCQGEAKVIAQLGWSLIVWCPDCGSDIDISKLDDNGTAALAIFSNDWSKLKGYEFECPCCKREFKLDGVEY